jgi:hypothetical protein
VRTAGKEYLRILHLAAYEGESLVEEALGCLAELGGAVRFVDVEGIVENWKEHPGGVPQPSIAAVALGEYDELLELEEAVG